MTSSAMLCPHRRIYSYCLIRPLRLVLQFIVQMVYILVVGEYEH